ncbi:hypothetical protein IV37_GL000142 [Fructilactobacillus fructivorans]|uniref:SHOCT domain-containing protein n=1 Tax=Fructilactobacillus fructivorans TaxID=1614 RepID=UPI0007050484|nr:SHOCT domain-containing protein [Fructilactobacillus fructivorans]KRN13425.1 hypothetical protein IV37_GL000142 [Fructilactobacillus fructivorans]
MVFTQEKDRKKIEKVASDFGLKDFDNLKIALKGTNKEYLFCDESKLYILKKGFMTGHMFGNQTYRMPYANISSVSVDYHMLSGYFEVSAGGVQDSKKNYWATTGKDSPQESPNTITLTGKPLKETFEKAADMINDIVANIHNPQNDNSTNQSNSAVDEIKKYKQLADDGIITNEEFEEKKKQLLEL